MDLGLTNKNALIAASSQGLGKAVALELIKEGTNVVICGRNKDRLDKTAAEFEELGSGKFLALQGDLTNSGDREFILNESSSFLGSIDILVTNTGGPPPGNFDDVSQQDWDNTYELLLGSAVSMIRAVLPGMKAKKWGRIITITSQAVKQPVDGLILSNAVRASLAGLTKSLSNELGVYGITVNNVMPGYTQTNRLMSLIEKNSAINNAIEEIPLKRFADPSEFGAAVVFLASERASYITGVSLAVDGGWIKNIL
jgi:3-oxoacyl-[acyl-carrier protein] reductase